MTLLTYRSSDLSFCFFLNFLTIFKNVFAIFKFFSVCPREGGKRDMEARGGGKAKEGRKSKAGNKINWFKWD